VAQRLKGVGGVLGGLITPDAAEAPAMPELPTELEQEAIPESKETPAKREKSTRPATSSPARGARRGRPPGQKTGEGAEKEKITLRISKALADEYRDWSWEERCQLGELVERAMSQYRKNRRKVE
jgi:hypothetical protein